ncbi:hypothetical protein [Reinekea marinisedimentorum]|nr:hypothetical protein [Reinekea marinisedimentorum]
MLNNAGLPLGKDLIQPHIANPRGYFEDMPAVQMHEKWLNDHGSNWQFHGEVEIHPKNSYGPAIKEYIAQRDRAGTAWGLKDPRLCLFLQAWNEALNGRGRFLFIIRSWQSCIESLYNRHSREITYLTNRSKSDLNLTFWKEPYRAASMWIEYNNRVIAFVRNNPHKCLLVTQKALFEGAPIIQLVNSLTNLDLNEATPHPFETKLINETASLNICLSLSNELKTKLDQTWNALLSLTAHKSTNESIEWQSNNPTSTSLSLISKNGTKQNISHESEETKTHQLKRLYLKGDGSGEKEYYKIYRDNLNRLPTNKLLSHYRFILSQCASTRMRLDLASRIIRHLEKINGIFIESGVDVELSFVPTLESQQTRLFPKNKGADKYRITGIARKCDWVITSDTFEPRTFITKLKQTITPQTIFLSLRDPFIAVSFFYEAVLPQLTSPFILITGSEDATIPNQVDKRWRCFNDNEKKIIQKILSSPNLIHWFAENLDDNNEPKLSPLPLGMVYPNYKDNCSIPIHSVPALSNRSHMVLCAHRERDGEQWITRKKVTQLAKNQWNSFCTILESEVLEEVFFNLCKTHKFVLCVEGGGLDPAPKAWHAIINGAIPIVKSSALDSCYKELPIAFIENWNEDTLSEKQLNLWIDKYTPFFEHADKRINILNKLGLEYWWNKIISKL